MDLKKYKFLIYPKMVYIEKPFYFKGKHDKIKKRYSLKFECLSVFIKEANMMKKILLLCSLLIGMGISISAFADTETSTLLTVKDYQQYLTDYSIQDAENAGVSGIYLESSVAQAKDQLNQFNALSEQEQINFIKTMSDSYTPTLEEQRILSNDEFATVNVSSGTTTKNVQYTYARKPGKYAPSITTVRIKVYYQTKGKRVLRTTRSDAYVVSNYNPMVNLRKNGQTRYVTGNQAYGWARWAYTIGLGKYGITPGNINISVKGNYNGTRTYYHGWS